MHDLLNTLTRAAIKVTGMHIDVASGTSLLKMHKDRLLKDVWKLIIHARDRYICAHSAIAPFIQTLLELVPRFVKASPSSTLKCRSMYIAPACP